MAPLTKGLIARAPFDFAEGRDDKERPVCIVSVDEFNAGGDVLIAMITSRPRLVINPGFGDVVLRDWEDEGLPIASVLRAGRLLARTIELLTEPIGELSVRDRSAVDEALSRILGLSLPYPR
ncbi:MAG: type II toxin-antitoxin system PemK/MazF family toxin [Actinomycetota bacterium]|nr:type II toxin-antitoxin system PemK/MazF family toxin [Actinomycetota bacterium]